MYRGGAAVVLSGALLAACAGPGVVQGPEGDPYLRGPIESITHRATASSLLVQPGPGSREACGIVATVDAETRYLRRGPEGAVRQATRSELSVGDTVEVYVDGPVAESCPVQGRASAVVLVGGGASR